MNFDAAYAAEILPILLQASLVTLQATFGGFALALIGGLFLALARMSRVRLVARGADLLLQFVRNTPFLIQLYFLFFVMPEFGIALDPLTTGILGLGIHFSTYMAEVYRAGIEAVPRGQWEAAVALSLSGRHTWARIILPQAIPPVIPVLGNYLISMFKDSAYLATIAVAELMQTALNLASLSFRYLEPLLLVAGIFLVMSLVASAIIRVLSRQLRPA
jgi:polar amino acid transport system permease protein